jgi:hypothetical protein
MVEDYERTALTMKYYALFTCDQWKSRDSMQFMGVFTKNRLISIINKGSNVFDFEEAFNKSMDVREMNNSIAYGYIEELSINEVL